MLILIQQIRHLFEDNILTDQEIIKTIKSSVLSINLDLCSQTLKEIEEGACQTYVVEPNALGELPSPCINPGDCHEGIVKHIDDPSSFYVKLHFLVRSERNNDFTTKKIIGAKVGSLCGYYDNAIEQVFIRRGIVAGIIESGYKVVDIDSGCQVILAQDDIYKLPVTEKQDPPSAMWCSLAGVGPKSDSWDAEAIAQFKHLFQSDENEEKSVRVEFIKPAHGGLTAKWLVNVTTGNINIASHLINAGHAVSTFTNENEEYKYSIDVSLPAISRTPLGATFTKGFEGSSLKLSSPQIEEPPSSLLLMSDSVFTESGDLNLEESPKVAAWRIYESVSDNVNEEDQKPPTVELNTDETQRSNPESVTDYESADEFVATSKSSATIENKTPDIGDGEEKDKQDDKESSKLDFETHLQLVSNIIVNEGLNKATAMFSRMNQDITPDILFGSQQEIVTSDDTTTSIAVVNDDVTDKDYLLPRHSSNVVSAKSSVVYDDCDVIDEQLVACDVIDQDCLKSQDNSTFVPVASHIDNVAINEQQILKTAVDCVNSIITNALASSEVIMPTNGMEKGDSMQTVITDVKEKGCPIRGASDGDLVTEFEINMGYLCKLQC
uniref:uncharacterized protein LOC104265991 n=1 Tax=Ciona intestinalis TaxID=7719 RepID=UPI00089DAA2A|nr:uncharacterized protein LOC104265991 [Ciona intestinalis]|eukprot:XP_009859554.2 uncharacterized protein LOC104265991 [Ciona intestinalis]